MKYVITKGMQNTLLVFTVDAFEELEEQLNVLPTTTDRSARTYVWFLLKDAINIEVQLLTVEEVLDAIKENYALMEHIKKGDNTNYRILPYNNHAKEFGKVLAVSEERKNTWVLF